MAHVHSAATAFMASAREEATVMAHDGATAFVTMGREAMNESWREDMRWTTGLMLQKDDNYTLFRAEDWKAWVTFTVVFTFLIVFDNVVMSRNPQMLTIGRAIVYTMFWVLMACCFGGWVYMYYDQAHAFMWMSGYLLEWMLSFDNLFVFHLIFQTYQCPDNQKHKALYLGIIGAVFFRVLFIFIGEYLMHAMFFMHLVFGAFLVYTGVKTMMVEDEDDDPSQHPMVLWLREKVSFLSVYDKNMAFFVNLPVDEKGCCMMPELIMHSARCSSLPDDTAAQSSETTPLLNSNNTPSPCIVDKMLSSRSVDNGDRRPSKYKVDFEGQTVDFAALNEKFGKVEGQKTKTFATMLFLVVCCLEISDLLFAVDSVSAIVAQVPDLFLAYTSAVFAMLGLRAMFFIIDVLVKLFSLLKYGVGIVLVFIGLKLCVARWYHVPPGIVCVILFGAIGGSMVASVLKEKYCPDPDSEAEDDGKMEKASLTDGCQAELTPELTPEV
jgi:tellurite resistance protein TerC